MAPTDGRSPGLVRWITGVVIGLLAAGGVFVARDDSSAPPDANPTTSITSTTAVDRSSGAAPRDGTAVDDTIGSEMPADVVAVPVERVVDGDTVIVHVDGERTRVRIIGIDTPETVREGSPVQCFGPEASGRAHELLDGRTVHLEFDDGQGREDDFGRALAYVWLPDGRLFTTVMLAEGFAKEFTYDGPYRHRDEHLEAQRSARDARRGLWSPDTCDGDTRRPAP